VLVALCRDTLPHCHTAISPAQIEALAARYQQLEGAGI
jgi:hypothetical protein